MTLTARQRSFLSQRSDSRDSLRIGSPRPVRSSIASLSSPKQLPNKSKEESRLCLNGLPVDIQRKIVGHCEGSLRQLRSVCCKWNSLVDDHLKRNRPKLGTLSVKMDDFNMRITLRLRKIHVVYYQSALTLVRDFKVAKFIHSEEDWLELEKYHFHHLPNHTKYLESMRGLVFESIHVKGLGDSRGVSKVDEILRMWKFDSLYLRFIQLTDGMSDSIVRLLCKNDVDHVHIEETKSEVRDPHCLLLKLADQVRTLSIMKTPSCDMQPLLGVLYRDWTAIIGEILSKKTNYLSLHDLCNPDLLKQETIQRLLEIVASSGCGKVLKIQDRNFPFTGPSKMSPSIVGGYRAKVCSDRVVIYDERALQSMSPAEQNYFKCSF